MSEHFGVTANVHSVCMAQEAFPKEVSMFI